MKKPKPPARGGKGAGPHPGHGKGHGGKGHGGKQAQKKPKPGGKTPKRKPVPARVKITRLRRQIHRLQHPHPAAHHHRRRQLSPGDVACCAAEALAASLRLQGVPVGDEDVLELYWRTAADADAGASILATLEAASRFGLAGVRPASFRPGWISETEFQILGVGLPGGSHALTLDPSGAVWSWGELYELPQLGPGRIEEAWLVNWEA